jgi:polysaccharide biosynthesis transport protein
VQPDARIISRALASSTAHFPKKLPIILIATIAAFIAMVSFIAAGQLLRGEVYRTAAPSIVPDEDMDAVEAPVLRAKQPLRHAPRIDGVADLSAQMRLMGRGIVIVTRTALEPSSDLALEVARDLAAGGARTIFADLDPETNVAARTLSPGIAGLSDVISGTVSFADAIQRDPLSRAHMLGLGRAGAGIAELLSAPRLSMILGALAQTYDHVVIATPDLTRFSHASRLARFVRGTVLVTDEGEARGAAASAQLAAMGFRNVVVVEAVPERRSAPEVAA